MLFSISLKNLCTLVSRCIILNSDKYDVMKYSISMLF